MLFSGSWLCYDNRRIISTDSDLNKLSPYAQFTTQIGRNVELQILMAFLQDDFPLLCRMITGNGGSSKTRLALMLCELANVWQAGFVTHAEL